MIITPSGVVGWCGSKWAEWAESGKPRLGLRIDGGKSKEGRRGGGMTVERNGWQKGEGMVGPH